MFGPKVTHQVQNDKYEYFVRNGQHDIIAVFLTLQIINKL